MPLVVVTSPERLGTDELLTAVADAVAEAMGLGDGDVLAMHVPSGVARASVSGEPRVWVLVGIHGRWRGEDVAGRAFAAADVAVRAWAAARGEKIDGVWTEWIEPFAATGAGGR